MQKAETLKEHHLVLPEKQFDTPLADVIGSMGLRIKSAALGNIELAAYVIKGELHLHSTGKLLRHNGISFVWIAEHCPCLILPSQRIIPLDIVHDIPYLIEIGIYTYCTSPDQIARLCGVLFVDGRLQFTDRAADPKLRKNSALRFSSRPSDLSAGVALQPAGSIVDARNPKESGTTNVDDGMCLKR